MSDVKIHLNLDAAGKQGVSFPKGILDKAARILRSDSATGTPPGSGTS